MGGESRILKITAIKAGRVAAAAGGSRRCLPGAHEAGRASSNSQMPGSSSPGRRARRAEGPRPLGPGTSATPARGSPSMAALRRRRRAPSSTGRRPGPASRLRALKPGRGGSCGCGWDGAPRTGAEGGRRGGGEPGAGTTSRGRQPHAGLAAPPPSEPRGRCRATRGPGRGEASTTSRLAGSLPARRPGGGRGAEARGTSRRGAGGRPVPRTRLPGGGAGGRGRPGPGPRAAPPRPSRGRREEGGSEERGRSGASWQAGRAAGLGLLESVPGSRCEPGACVYRAAFRAARRQSGGAVGLPFQPPACNGGVRIARTLLYPSFLGSRGSASSLGYWETNANPGRPANPARSRPSGGAC